MTTQNTQHVSFGTKLIAYIGIKVLMLKPFHKYHNYFLGDTNVEAIKEKGTLKNLFTNQTKYNINMQINTINVVEYNGTCEMGITSFSDDDSKGAEDLFRKLLTEQGENPDLFEAYLNDGFYFNGEYELYFIHS